MLFWTLSGFERAPHKLWIFNGKFTFTHQSWTRNTFLRVRWPPPPRAFTTSKNTNPFGSTQHPTLHGSWVHVEKPPGWRPRRCGVVSPEAKNSAQNSAVFYFHFCPLILFPKSTEIPQWSRICCVYGIIPETRYRTRTLPYGGITSITHFMSQNANINSGFRWTLWRLN